MQNKKKGLQAMYPKLAPGQSHQGFEPLQDPILKAELVTQMLCPIAKRTAVYFVGYCNNFNQTVNVYCFSSEVAESNIVPIQKIIATGIALAMPKAWVCRTNVHSANINAKWDELQISAIQLAGIMQNFLLIDYLIVMRKGFISYCNYEKTAKRKLVRLDIETKFNQRYPHAATI